MASSLAVGEFARLAGTPQATVADLTECVHAASTRIDALGNAGTTIVAAVVTIVDARPYWMILNLGDSRAYQWIRGIGEPTLRQVSVDHSVVQEMVESGEIAQRDRRLHPSRHLVTRALGAGSESIEPDYWLIPLEGGERLVLCSDGLTDELSDAELLAILNLGLDVQRCAELLTQAACDRGGHDNVSVIVVEVEGQPDTDSVQTDRRGERGVLTSKDLDDSDTLPRSARR
ncbi:serine/threonine-protein phosphatase [Micrococcales bacterium 31B]|nr:serine/threonine-protein phosphatase [Micrococcales bacterium 31B]